MKIKAVSIALGLLLLNLNAFAQIVFEKGYIVDEQGSKSQAYIKNLEWKNNPSQFEYKTSETGETKTGDLQTIQEFGIGEGVVYKRFKVQMDRSSEEIKDMNSSRTPEFTEETQFLKVLVTGPATLYGYEDGNLRRYFYQLDNSGVEPLVNKAYLTGSNKLAYNSAYKQELLNNLKCESITQEDAADLDYTKRSLSNFFVAYNTCVNPGYANAIKKQKSDVFHLSLRPRVRQSSLSVYNESRMSEAYEFADKTGFAAGIMAEFVLPYNKGKWAIILEPVYQSYSDENETGNRKVDYTSVELPIGIRHYFFLNEESRVFVNALIAFDFPMSSTVNYVNTPELEVYSRNNIAFGAGYSYGRYSAEVRYNGNREILSDYLAWDSKYSSFALILGYQLF